MAHGLEDQLRAGGEKVAEGVFKVDAKRALEKLRSYRLAEPHHWVLEVLRAASSSKARSVDIETDTDDIIIRFDGDGFSAEVMKDLLAQALDAKGQGSRRSARYLSLGIAGALGLDPKWIKVCSGKVSLELVPPDQVTVAAAKDQAAGTLVHVRKKFGWGVVKAALYDATPEEAAVVERARRFGPTLTVNKRRIGGGSWFDGDFVVAQHFEGDGMTIHVGVPADAQGGTLVLDIDGVIVARRALQLPARFVVAWARCDAMRRNASGSDVVDSDPAVKAVLAKVAALAIEVTAKMGALLADGKAKEPWRQRYQDYALECFSDSKVDPLVRPVLAGFPIIPGLHGQWFSPDDFTREVEARRPLYYCTENFPRGSYPSPMARLASVELDPLMKLLPKRQLVNAAKRVRATARAAEARQRWLDSPIEDGALPSGRFLARASISGPSLSGEVGLVDSHNEGAHVRFLCQGRFIQQGDVGTLAPLRLRAVINWHKDVPEKLWPEIPSDKLWTLALEAVDAAAQKAVLAGLWGAERPSPELAAHAHDLLVRRVTAGGTASKLPAALRAAPIFELTSGEAISLDGLMALKTWRYVTEPADATLLSGEPVMIVSPALRSALAKLSPRAFEDAADRFHQEREIRVRLARPKKAAVLGKLRVVVDLEGEGLTGQVGVGEDVDFGLNLTLLRDGVELEKTSLTAAYEFAHAIVECKDFVPNADWDTAVRDATFDRALLAVRRAEEQLAGALVEQVPSPLALMPPGYCQFLTQYLRKHSKGKQALSPTAQRVENAPLFRTAQGTISLAAIRLRLGSATRLWVLRDDFLRAPPSMFVLVVQPEQESLLQHLLEVQVENATGELMRMALRAAYLARPETRPQLPPGVSLSGVISQPGIHGLLGLAASDDRVADLEVIVADRLFTRERFKARLPLAGTVTVDGVDTAAAELPGAVSTALSAALRIAEVDILRRALQDLQAPGARRAALLAIQHQLEAELPSDLGDALGALPLFPCTDGGLIGARAIDRSRRVLFVTRPLASVPSPRAPVIVAFDPGVRRALARWVNVEDVTTQLEGELQARARRARIAPRAAIKLTGPTLWLRSLESAGLEGQLAVVEQGGGRLELLHERKPLAVLEAALPPALAAIVNCEQITIAAFSMGIARDAKFDALIDALHLEADLLLDTVAGALFAAPADERARLGPRLASLAFWLAGRKKRGARLIKIPLFTTSDDGAISLHDLFEEQKAHKVIQVSPRAGAPLDAGRWVWRPRDGEVAALQQVLKVKVMDVTPALEHAAEVRTRRAVTQLVVTGDFCEPLATARVQGEVALRAHPSRELVIQLHRERVPLELFSAEHPIGAIASVNSDALVPNADWTRANRNLHFKQVICEVEDAIERLVVRRLLGPVDGHWRDFAEAALRWKRGPGGPLAELIPRLALFKSLTGEQLTVGAVLEEHSRSGRILIANRSLPAPKDKPVLERTDSAVALLGVLGLKTEDISDLLERSAAIADGLEHRRLASLVWQGDAIVRLPLASEGLTGELVFANAGEVPLLVLAKDGIEVCTYPVGEGLPIGGVVNVEGLEVNEDWTKAVVTRHLKDQLDEAVEQLLGALAAKAASLAPAHKLRARDATLVLLSLRGVTSPTHLERMTGAAAALARAPVFLSEGAQWVSICAVADQVLRRGWVSIFETSWLKRDTLEELVLRASTLRDPWISALEKVLGSSRVERVHDVSLWRKQLGERDPPPGTSGNEGLKRLRKQMRLLRAGALGHVTPDELDDVRIKSDGADAPITFDRRRRLVLLDGSNPRIARALEEIPQRPERLYVLLAAIYGAVNRALWRVTDADESQLLTALAAHLAANPKSLAPSAPD